MSHLFNLVKKELRELLTPGTIIPMIVMVLVLASIGPIMNVQPGSATELAKIGVMDRDGGSVHSLDAVAYIDEYYTNAGVNPDDYVTAVAPVPNDGIRAVMEEKGLNVLLVIEDGYNTKINAMDPTKRAVISTFWYQSGSSSLTSMPEGPVDSVLSYVNYKTSLELIDPSDPQSSTFARSPVSYGTIYSTDSPHRDESNSYVIVSTGELGIGSPSAVSASMMSQNMFISIIMMLIIIMIGSILISSMGSEKENKTLETLLTLPVSRTTIVGGKLIGSAIVGLIFGAVYLIGMYFSMMGTMNAAGGLVNLNELGMSLDILDWAIIGVFLFMAIMCALGLCMILGAFAKNYKAAQTLIMPVSVLAMIPMFLTMYGSFDTLSPVLQGVMFAIPFSHPMTVMQNLMFGNEMMVIAGLAYLVGFALVTMLITVKLYKSDILLTGFIKTKKTSWLNLSLHPKKPEKEE